MANIGSDYVKFSMFSACLIGLLPMLFRAYKTQASNNNNGNGTRITFNGAFTNVSFFIDIAKVFPNKLVGRISKGALTCYRADLHCSNWSTATSDGR